MSGPFPPVGGMTPSGINWLGEVPSHWRLLPARVALKNLTEKNEDASNQDYLSLVAGLGVMPYAEKGDMGNKKPDDLSKCKVVRKGNIVVNSMNFFIGAFGMSDYDGVCSPVYIVLDVAEGVMERRFALRIFGDQGFQQFLSTFGDGILKHRAAINWDDIKVAYIPFPPVDEQTQIAKFLDYKTARIDALIEKQQQLIALLKEKRQAVISHAVTKGLNPDAPMRDTGVEWLGEVPAHWKVCRVKQVTGFITSGPRGWSELIAEDGSGVFLQSGDLDDKLGLRLKHAKRITPPRNAEGVRTRMQVGDVVVCITGANTGRVAVATRLTAAVFVNQHLSLVRPIQGRTHPSFLAIILSSSAVKSYFAVKQYGLKEGLSLTNVAEAPLCLPPLAEQRSIVAHLETVGDRLDRLEMLASQQVDVLQERRTALISAAVTGKVDVRNWQPPKSEPEPESESAAVA